MRVALDTNVLAYAEGVGDDWRKDHAANVIGLIGAENLLLSSQVAGEFYNVLTRKDRKSRVEAVRIVAEWTDTFLFVSHQPEAFDDALRLARDHQFQIWDALIVCVAAANGCRLLLSEDMQDGFVYRGVTVANPFAETLHPLLASLLDTLSERSE